MNLCHLFDFCHPINQLGKCTSPNGTARGDPVLMEGTVYIRQHQQIIQTQKLEIKKNPKQLKKKNTTNPHLPAKTTST